MAADYEFIDGFDGYGPIGCLQFPANTAGEWTLFGSGTLLLVAPLSGSGGCALQLGPANNALLSKTLPGNFARSIGGATIRPNTSAGAGVTFLDGGTQQLTVFVNASGNLVAARGGVTGVVLGTSALSMSLPSTHILEWDITFHPSLGIVNLYIDGNTTPWLSLTNQNTIISANHYFNVFDFLTSSSGTCTITVDHFYLRAFLASGSADTPLFTNPIIDTDFGTADSSVAFTPTAGVLGQAYSTTGTTSAPGANELVLRRFVAGVGATVNSIGILPAATSGAAKFKGVIYSDSAGIPNTLLSSGTEVVGCTAATTQTLALVTPQALSAATAYWIGYITDTSIALTQVDTTTNASSKAANTYTSGAPGTAPAMTAGQPSWQIWGNVTGLSTNYSQVGNAFSNPPLGDLSFNQANVVGKEDLYTFGPLSANAGSIATVAVKAYCRIGTPGVRSVTLQTKSSGTDSSGSASPQAVPLSYNWLSSYFDADPNGSIPWTASTVNAATSGIKVVG